MVSRNCKHCERTFDVDASQLQYDGYGQFCSRACHYASRRALPHKPVRRSDGRTRIYAPEHPHASQSGYVYEYRLVAEAKLGRYLSREEVVHHLNGDASDNRPENLEVTTPSEHARTHMRARHQDAGVPVDSKRCPRCSLIHQRSALSSNGICRPCNARIQREYRRAHPERVRETARRAHAKKKGVST